MTDRERLAEQFELARPHLRAVAYTVLGSVAEAEDAVQECWLRLDRSDAGTIDNLGYWLTTVVGRISLDMLRARRRRREHETGTWLPEPVVETAEPGPEEQAVLADTVGLALLVVLESLGPSERLAFVLHDVFALPFDEIGRILDRSPESARQLASRARHRVQAAPRPDADPSRQRRVVDAFLAAARAGDFEALLDVLAPDVVLRGDLGRAGPAGFPTRVGADAVARHVLRTAPHFIARAHPVLVNGAPGLLFGTREEPLSVLGFTVVGGRIAALDLIVDPAKLRHLA
ncbi:RNA polymerase sigma factor SigJ [Streptacidiphilus melanogenes]|uniref:RNA polymerase sigma factor SigJ n=1 Tax=Streptacidiphilus melanogenes TaxID=411235 RepID=UPI0005A9E1F9|nr:RNA polymerase sigma factor SigJ [Streptacidiphilus melanogenes]